ncbi:MAG TPA: hypothetical protein VG965_03820 [Patescibacteria group bacterium]|nr:hypothetical protein [Patescibacteria group bacterium]
MPAELRAQIREKILGGTFPELTARFACELEGAADGQEVKLTNPRFELLLAADGVLDLVEPPVPPAEIDDLAEVRTELAAAVQEATVVEQPPEKVGWATDRDWLNNQGLADESLWTGDPQIYSESPPTDRDKTAASQDWAATPTSGLQSEDGEHYHLT